MTQRQAGRASDAPPARREPATAGPRGCPLCGGGPAGPSWVGTVRFLGRHFTYVECRSCGSSYCTPMPAAAELAVMYGPDYALAGDRGLDDGTSEFGAETLRYLRTLGPPGVFCDYGCGDGRLLVAARRAGWAVSGVEYVDEVAARLRRDTGAQVWTSDQIAQHAATVDVLHLGDVIEHLTRIEEQLPCILSLVRPGGLVIAQGPLEANWCLFTQVIRVARRLRPRPIDMPPYHVILATAIGQRRLFDRMGLRPLAFSVREVPWPAPARLSLEVLRGPRLLALYGLRHASRVVSRLNPARWGNRYFFVGQRHAAPC